MASNKKGSYRRLINNLYGIVRNIDNASSSVNEIQLKLSEGIKVNEEEIETDSFSKTKTNIEEAEEALYRAIRSCNSSMRSINDEEQ